MKKRVLNFLLTFLMIAAALPSVVNAEENVVAKIADLGYASFQEAIDAATLSGGDQTITLVPGTISEDVTVVQTAGTNITIKGDSVNTVYTGKITVYGQARYEGAETLTLDGIVFKAAVNDQIFIESNSTDSDKRYAHNVTVQNCTFDANGFSSVVGMKWRQAYNIKVTGVAANGLHSLMQCYGCTGLDVNGVIIQNGKSGIALGTSSAVTVKNTTIIANAESGYGLRAEPSDKNSVLTVENCNISAYVPLLVRDSVKGSYALIVNGSNAMTAYNADGYWAVVSGADYDGAAALVAPTAQVAVEVTDAGLDIAGVYPTKAETVAKVGNTRYSSLQKAINAATAAGGDQTITLLPGAVSENVTVVQTPGVNLTFKGDGVNTVYSGTVLVYGQARYTGAETLTFDGIVFRAAADSIYFIDSNSTDSDKRYAHNVTVQNCTFDANGFSSVVGMRLRQSYNIKVVGVKANGLHSLMQCYGCTGLDINSVIIENGKSGIALGTSIGVTVKNTTISANPEAGYGLRAEPSGNDSVLTVENCNISAYIPLLVRDSVKGSYALIVNGSNVMKEHNADGYWAVVSGDDYDGETALVVPTTEVVVEVTDNGLDMGGVYPPNCEAVAKIGTTRYASLQKAIDAATAAGGNQTITLLPGTISENVAVVQKAGANITVKGDGVNTIYTGTITVDGSNRYTGEETLTFDGIVFEATGDKYFIDANVAKEYAHNITVKNSSFKGDGQGAVVGLRVRQGFGIKVENVTADGLHSLMQCYGCTGVEVLGVTIANSKSGIALGTSKDVTVKNTVIDVNKEGGYGLRAESSVNNSVLTVENCSITAYVPVLVRKATTGAYTVIVNGSNKLVPFNPEYNWAVVSGEDYDGATDLVAPTAECAVVINDEYLDEAGVYPTEVETIAKIGNTKYSSLQTAINAATAAGGDQTITLLPGTISENVTVVQTKGANITIQGDGANTVYTGTVSVHGRSRSNGEETLTFDGIVFKGSANGQNFIDFNSNSSAVRYAHNVTVKNCTFDGNGFGSVAGLRFRQAYNVKVENSKSTNMFSLMQGTSTDGISIENVVIENNSYGITVDTSKNVTVKNTKISVNATNSYGIRAQSSGNKSVLTVENCEISAYVPVIVRRCDTGSYTLKVGGNNTIEKSNTLGYWAIFSGVDGYDLVEPTSKYTVELTDDCLDRSDVFPFKGEVVAELGGETYASLQTAINVASALGGDQTITLLPGTLSENVTVVQKEGANITFKGDGANTVYTGTFSIHGRSRSTGAETLTFDGIVFKAGADSQYFIDANSKASAERYAHNVTVKNCTFDGNGFETVVALKLRAAYNFKVENVSSTGLFSLMQSTGCTGVDIENVTIENDDFGIEFGTSKDVTVKNTKINVSTTSGYGIRAESSSNKSVLTVEDCEISAFLPVIIRRCTSGSYTLKVGGNNTIKEYNTLGYWTIFSATAGYDLVEPTSAYTVELTDNKLNEAGAFPFKGEVVAQLGNTRYASLQKAINAATALGGDQTITLLPGTISENVTVVQTKGANITIQGDGANTVYTGTVSVHGRSRSTGAETLTFDGIVFKAGADSQYFIDANSRQSAERYAHNVTVKNCTFDGNGFDTVVALKLRAAYNTKVENVSSTGLFSLMQSTGCTGLLIDNVTIENDKFGMEFGTSMDVTVKNTKISVNTTNGYGIRAESSSNKSVLTVEDCEITAFVPVIIRKCTTGSYTLKVAGNNTITKTHPTNYWAILTTTNGYDLSVPTTPNVIEITDPGLDRSSVFPYYYPESPSVPEEPTVPTEPVAPVEPEETPVVTPEVPEVETEVEVETETEDEAEDVVEIEDEDTPLAGGEVEDEDVATEEVEDVVVIEDEETPLAPGEAPMSDGGNNYGFFLVLLCVLAVLCVGAAVVVAQRKKEEEI